MKIGALFADHWKVFDTLNHRHLLAKLKAYDLQLAAPNLIQNYHTVRYQNVNNVCSSWSEIIATQLTFTCSKSTIKTLNASIVDFEQVNVG